MIMNNKFYANDVKFTFDDVMIVPKFSQVASRSESILDTATKMGRNSFKIPLIASNMDTITDTKMAITMAKLGGLGIIHRYMSVEATQERLDTWQIEGLWSAGHPLALSVGSIDNILERARINTILRNSKRSWSDDQIILCVDLAHGDSQHMINSINAIRKEYGFLGTIIAGNTATFAGTSRLLNAGADIVRVGIGGGSACTTRQKTGCGIPQLSSVLDSTEAGPIISDGGHRIPGDVAKAFAAGAQFVMLGGMLAGTDGTPAWDKAMAYHQQALQYGIAKDLPEVPYRGMASKEAKLAFSGTDKNAEGASFRARIQPKNSTQDVIENIMEGVRSAMSYVNATTITEFGDRAQFVRVTPTTLHENLPHFGLK